MLRTSLAFSIALSLSACVHQTPEYLSYSETTPRTQQETDREFDSRIAELRRDREGGQLTQREFSERGYGLAETYYPTDSTFLALWKYRIYLSDRLERGEIRKPEFDSLLADKAAQHDAAQRAQSQYVEQSSRPEAPNLMPYFMLNGLNEGFRRAYPAPQPAIRCTTLPGLNGSTNTTCL